ncbi:hypothetical protein DPMN_076433 [Dreissena polymorpha]|uniref:Uncharacterized protein n=1 Tax=Dreissena polymorpha TaxID=45954 RepID=A0A9D4BFR7_DREPO|nr:hypothetical protein DPMN_076433 [Dreissena polymorpha]
MNVALGRPATQTFTLNYLGYNWAAGLAVDGCGQAEIIANKSGDVENSRCCSGSFSTGSFDEWRVTLGQTYNIDHIVIEGRFGTCISSTPCHT